MRTSWPPAITASVVQLLTGVPSIHTVHAPQLEVSQPQWVPVRREVVAQEVDEQQARLDVARDLLAVDVHGDIHQASSPPARAADRVRARVTSSRARWRL